MGMGASTRVASRIQAAVLEAMNVRTSFPPPLLYHYTTQAGLLGIVTTAALYLSDFRSLNDSSEIAYGRQLFLERLRLFCESSDDPKRPKVLQRLQEVEALGSEKTASWGNPTDLFIASFCATANLLSQWRGYGSATGGCSIAFTSQELVTRATLDPLSALVPGQQVRLLRVLYDPSEQVALVDDVIQRLFAAAESVNHVSWPVYLADGMLGTVIPMLAPCLKSPVFEAEREWRLVSQLESARQFRISNGLIVPYLFCKFRADANGSDRLPISEVMVGPSQHAESSRSAIRALLNGYGYSAESVAVSVSDIPLRTR